MLLFGPHFLLFSKLNIFPWSIVDNPSSRFQSFSFKAQLWNVFLQITILELFLQNSVLECFSSKFNFGMFFIKTQLWNVSLQNSALEWFPSKLSFVMFSFKTQL
jgi:hypothetical protein